MCNYSIIAICEQDGVTVLVEEASYKVAVPGKHLTVLSAARERLAAAEVEFCGSPTCFREKGGERLEES
jgi:hypothetical protein